MIREFIKSAGDTYLLNLPKNMIGKTVEIIAFEVDNEVFENNIPNIANKEVDQRYAKYPRISHASFFFDRDEANNHE